MTDPLPPVTRVMRRVRLFHTAAGVLLALIGLVALVIGAVFTASQTWPSATGTVGECTTVSTRTGSSGTPTYRQRCEVSWMDGARRRTTYLDLDTARAAPGAPVALRYRGDTAVEETPPWLGLTTGGVGLALVAAGVFVALRARRRYRD
ncbi:DUF3592 domain-containing protein [Phytohabitans suffuscus]|uniref:DUF3592 domain-containing protein n=1 Tax=Phytohabitans suffuscus TaxID=624315 RepID=A0A6F8YX59_9ACTN|nr:DUF3592 domain-containing protein [Phytohabitans suffuscus]BCB90528.1 hypothetical protein Psuf_078410 [Phytohabitans suffuscus]